MSGQVDGLMANSFHEATIASYNICVMIDQRATELRCESPFSEGHPNGSSDPLTQWPCSCLNPCCMAKFRVPCSPSTKLPKLFQLISTHIGITEQVVQRIVQHRTMTGGENKSVAIGPLRIRRINIDVVSK